MRLCPDHLVYGHLESLVRKRAIPHHVTARRKGVDHGAYPTGTVVSLLYSHVVHARCAKRVEGLIRRKRADPTQKLDVGTRRGAAVAVDERLPVKCRLLCELRVVEAAALPSHRHRELGDDAWRPAGKPPIDGAGATGAGTSGSGAFADSRTARPAAAVINKRRTAARRCHRFSSLARANPASIATIRSAIRAARAGARSPSYKRMCSRRSP